MQAGSVWAAPAGTKPGADGWKLIGSTTDGITATESFSLSSDRAALWFGKESPLPESDLREHIQRMIIDAYCGYSSQRYMLGIDQATTNERSKPMGLTKDHRYTDNDGDYIEVRKPHNDPDGTVAHVATNDDEAGAYVTSNTAVPLALNVLGYDRPSSELYAEGSTQYNGKSANTPIPSSQEQRDANVALAIDYLRGADIFDQRVAEREAKAAERAAYVAEHEARIEAKEVARTKLAELADLVASDGVTRVRADALQIAVTDYKKAVDAVGAAN